MKELKLRLEDHEYDLFADTAYKHNRMKHQAALKQAVRLWIDRPAVPESEQTLTCPACESTLSVALGDPPKLVVLEAVPPTKQRLTVLGVLDHNSLSDSEREWIAVLRRAMTVRSETWRKILQSAQSNLMLVAETADDESSGGDLQKLERNAGAPPVVKARSRSGRPARPRGKEAG